MTVSVYIPTIPNHIKFLDKILNSYLIKSTVKPNQIIVSVSNFNEIDKELYHKIKNNYTNVLFLEHDSVELAGPNRQFSKDYCTEDIIIYQDSDDLPHIQRIEIIKYFFENYDILHLHHSYFNLTNDINSIKNEDSFNYNEELINVNDIKLIESKDFYSELFPNNSLLDVRNNLNFNKIFNKFKPHHGSFAIKKDVLNTIKWKNRKELNYSPGWDNMSYKGAEDYEFMVETIYFHNKSIIIDGRIYFYFG